MKADVLDHGYVRLVSYTQPVPVLNEDYQNVAAERWTGDLEIVRAARVSYNADWRADQDDARNGRNQSKDEKLIHYLWSHGHTSPFEAMSFSFEVQAPIFVFRQWHRHRTQSYNEVSARYTELPDLFYIPAIENIEYQSTADKQGRSGPLPEHAALDFRNDYAMASYDAHKLYKAWLAYGVSRELARIVLPVNTYSRMYASANLLNWFRFLTLRTDPHAQYEIRVYADAMVKLLETVCPIAVAAWRASRD